MNISREEILKNYQGEDSLVSSLDYASNINEKPEIRYKTDIPTLDSLLDGGFEPGEMVIVTGYTGFGKTQLCQTFTQNFAKNSVISLWFSYELTPRQFFSRFSEVPLFYLPKTLRGSALNWLEERFLEGILKYGIKVVFIDHLGYLVDLAQSKNPAIDISTVCRQLKQLALKYKLVLFLIAHTGQPKDDKMPSLGSIKDASGIAQESDWVLCIHRKRIPGQTEYLPESILGILKARRVGSSLGKTVKLALSNKTFLELDSVIEQNQPSICYFDDDID